MIGDMIDAFRNTAAAANQEFVGKNQIETNTCHRGSHSKFDKSIISFQVTTFCCPMFTSLRSLHSNQGENERIRSKKRRFWTIYTILLLSDDVKKC